MSSLVDIDSKGYGKIFKLVMRDRSLPLLAKTIYAYFCAYAGCGCHTFPKRDKVLHDLQINKDTFTKHLNLLVEGRYISKERTGTGNVYTILQRIPVYAETLKVEQGQSDMLVFENAAAHGFGTIPKLVMLNPQLTPRPRPSTHTLPPSPELERLPFPADLPLCGSCESVLLRPITDTSIS